MANDGGGRDPDAPAPASMSFQKLGLGTGTESITRFVSGSILTTVPSRFAPAIAQTPVSSTAIPTPPSNGNLAAISFDAGSIRNSSLEALTQTASGVGAISPTGPVPVGIDAATAFEGGTNGQRRSATGESDRRFVETHEPAAVRERQEEVEVVTTYDGRVVPPLARRRLVARGSLSVAGLAPGLWADLL